MTEPAGPTIEDRFASLEESNRALAADVRALTATLEVVNALQQEQREQAKRGQETDTKVAELRQEAHDRITRTRRVVNLSTLALAILLPLVSIVLYTSLISHVNDLLNQQASDRLSACRQRNAGNTADADRERELATLEPAGSRARAIHTQSADAIDATKIDCERLYRRAT